MTPDKQAQAEELVRQLITLIGDDPSREGLLDTPKRVVKSWSALYAGYQEQASDFARVFEDSYDTIVALGPVDYFSTCEHHMLPFFGKAHVAYLPKLEDGGKGKVLGVSKIARIVNACARKLQIQERMTREIAEAIQSAAEPRAVAVVVEGTHLCMVARGVNQQHAVMRTSAMLGHWLEDHRGKDEAMRLLGF